jgi:hypothetical protein
MGLLAPAEKTAILLAVFLDARSVGCGVCSVAPMKLTQRMPVVPLQGRAGAHQPLRGCIQELEANIVIEVCV